MKIEITVDAVQELTDRFSTMSAELADVVRDTLLVLGIVVIPRHDGGFDVTTVTQFAREQVVRILNSAKEYMK